MALRYATVRLASFYKLLIGFFGPLSFLRRTLLFSGPRINKHKENFCIVIKNTVLRSVQIVSYGTRICLRLFIACREVSVSEKQNYVNKRLCDLRNGYVNITGVQISIDGNRIK